MITGQLVALAAMLLTLWIVGLGFAMMLQQHQQYWNWSRRQPIRFFRWLWQNFRTQIIWFAIGFLTALIVTS